MFAPPPNAFVPIRYRAGCCASQVGAECDENELRPESPWHHSRDLPEGSSGDIAVFRVFPAMQESNQRVLPPAVNQCGLRRLIELQAEHPVRHR